LRKRNSKRRIKKCYFHPKKRRKSLCKFCGKPICKKCEKIGLKSYKNKKDSFCPLCYYEEEINKWESKKPVKFKISFIKWFFKMNLLIDEFFVTFILILLFTEYNEYYYFYNILVFLIWIFTYLILYYFGKDGYRLTYLYYLKKKKELLDKRVEKNFRIF